MEKPDANTLAWFEAGLPADARAVPGQMFGHRCAFVNGNMFYGTFSNSVVLRVGEARTAALSAEGTGKVFEPMPGRGRWREYTQIDVGSMPEAQLAGLALEALDHTAALPAKPAKGKKKA